MEKVFNKCGLRRCQGQRGCICPKKPGAPGTYSSPALNKPPPTLEELQSNHTELMKGVDEAGGQPPDAVATAAAEATPKLPKIAAKSPSSSSSPAAAAKAKDKAKDKLVPIAAAEAAPAPAPPPEEELGNGQNGSVTIRFNHYKKQFTINDGMLKASIIDSEYHILFAYPGAKIHLTTYGPSDYSYEEQGLTSPPILREKPAGTFLQLEVDKVYYVQI